MNDYSSTGRLEFLQRCIRCGFQYPNTVSHQCPPEISGTQHLVEITRLTAENEALKRERDIYKKAVEHISQNYRLHQLECVYCGEAAQVAQQALKDAGDVRGKE